VKTISVCEAKRHFSRILEEVSEGQSFLVTRYGRPVGILSPVDAKPKMDRKKAIEHFRTIQKRGALKGLSVKEMIEEGRR